VLELHARMMWYNLQAPRECVLHTRSKVPHGSSSPCQKSSYTRFAVQMGPAGNGQHIQNPNPTNTEPHTDVMISPNLLPSPTSLSPGTHAYLCVRAS
jgi:hypothetical protein